MGKNLWGALNAGAANGILYGGFPFSGNQWFLGESAPNFGRRVGSWEELLSLMRPRDIAFIGPGGYEEGSLVIPESLSNITIIGAGNRGSVFIEPPDSNQSGLQVLADDVTLVNIGVAGDGTGYGLKVGSQTVSPVRFRAYGCKFEGPDGANPAAAVVLQGTGDVRLEDCEMAWTAAAVLFAANDNGFVTQTLIKNCLLHNYVTVGLGIAVDGEVRDLWVIDNVFGRQEDGTAGTDDILLSSNNHTGFISGNRFPRDTNGTGFITIGTGLIYNPNGTEAGWSTARPA